MIADTTFVSDYLREQRRGRRGSAHAFLSLHRAQALRISIISAGEIAVMFGRSDLAWDWLGQWTIYRLHPGIVSAAADLDRAMIAAGTRLGENDNWIAGFCRYYREPIISRDAAFDRAGVRRLPY
jgi:predicted nucleic acid-binding protein